MIGEPAFKHPMTTCEDVSGLSTDLRVSFKKKTTTTTTTLISTPTEDPAQSLGSEGFK